jgi:protein-S-isoprenylcysteine O-methyltransferase Ste14
MFSHFIFKYIQWYLYTLCYLTYQNFYKIFLLGQYLAGIFINKRLIHNRFRKVIKMSEGYKRHSHEDRKDLAGEYRWGDTGQIVLLFVFIIGMISDLFLFKVSDSWQDVYPWYFRIVIFLPLLFVAGYFAQQAHKKVFKEERKELMVIKTDVFARIRHPMYFGSILTYLGFVILSLSVIALLIFVVIVIFYYYLCRYEEQLLLAKLGDEYKNYMKNVPMLIPKVRK